MKQLFFFFMLCVLLLSAQQPSKTPPPATTVDEEIAEVEATPGEFIYKAEGRRDPFWNLMQVAKPGRNRGNIEGIAGLMIDELDLEGIVNTTKGFRALMKGPDGRPYMVSKGTKVYDGEVLSIEKHSISFKKILTIAMGGQKERVVVKTLNPEEEGTNQNDEQE